MYSTNPVKDAAVYYDALYSQAEKSAALQTTYERMFFSAVMDSDSVTEQTDIDMRTKYRPGNLPEKRYATVGEVMADSLDYAGGPQMDDVCQFLVNEAKAGNIEAKNLIKRMAATWAKFKV